MTIIFQDTKVYGMKLWRMESGYIGVICNILIVGDRGFEPRSGIQFSKRQNVSSLLTRKYSISWGASVTER